jgi:general secretion pathway protein M
MSAVNAIRQVKDQLALYWLARTEQERKFLGAGAAVLLVALVYSLFVEPALSGRAELRRQLPELRQQASQLEAMAQEAAQLARRTPPQVAPMTRASVAASLAARSITPEALSVTGNYAKLQINSVSFANLYGWLDAQRREHRIGVQDAQVSAQSPEGQVDATLTLHQNTGQGEMGAR